MKFFGKREEKQAPVDEPRTESPFITFTLVDGMHLNVRVGWPRGCDVKPFAQVLAWLNAGNFVEAQIAAVLIHAQNVGEPEKASLIRTILDSNKTASGSRPLVPPSKVIPTQLKTNGY